MLKKILIVSSLAMISVSAFADVVAPPLYNIEVKDTDGVLVSSVFAVTTPIGKVMPVQVTQDNKDNSTNCSLTVKDNLELIELNVEQKNNIGINAIIYPMSIDGDNIKLMLSYSKQDDVTSEKAVTINDKCHFANAVSTTTTIQWLGDVKLNKKTKIPVTGKSNLIVLIKKVNPNDKD